MGHARAPEDIRGWDRPSGSRPGSVGRAPGMSGTTAGGSAFRPPLDPVAAISPFYEVKPRSGIDAYFNQTGVLAAVAGAAVEFGAGLFVLPSANVGVIGFLTIFVDAPNTTINVIWTLLLNGAPIPGWERITTFPRVANNLSIVYPGTVQIPKRAAITVRVTNQAATGPWTVGAEVGGWHWPEVDELQTFGKVVGA